MVLKILTSITSGSNNIERNILRSFHDGIVSYFTKFYGTDSLYTIKKTHGIDLRLSYDPEIEKCDVAVQFGTVKERLNEHHVTRQSIRKNAKTVIYIETPLLGRRIVEKSNHTFYRVAVNGFLNNDGIFYREKELDKARLGWMRRQLEIPEFPGWKDHKSGAILILLQLPGDASLRGQKLSEWLVDTVFKIRSFTNREILIRMHPSMSDKGRAEFFSELYPMFLQNPSNIRWLDGTSPLSEDFKKAGVCVSYTSGSSIDAVLSGIPVITTDEGNPAYPISSRNLDSISNPRLATNEEINHWLSCLANSQWTEDEMLKGMVWKNIYPIVEECRTNMMAEEEDK